MSNKFNYFLDTKMCSCRIAKSPLKIAFIVDYAMEKPHSKSIFMALCILVQTTVFFSHNLRLSDFIYMRKHARKKY